MPSARSIGAKSNGPHLRPIRPQSAKGDNKVTQAQHTHSGTSALLPAAAAAFVMAAALAVTILVSGQVSLPTINDGASVGAESQAVIDAGRAWQLQREQQAGMGAMSGAVLDSARQWEEQRKAQSGAGSTTDRGTTPTDPTIR